MVGRCCVGAPTSPKRSNSQPSTINLMSAAEHRGPTREGEFEIRNLEFGISSERCCVGAPSSPDEMGSAPGTLVPSDSTNGDFWISAFSVSGFSFSALADLRLTASFRPVKVWP